MFFAVLRKYHAIDMKRSFFFIVILFSTVLSSLAQVNDSAKNELIRNRVNAFFQKQHKISAAELRRLNQQYIVYATFEYDQDGRVTLLPEIADDSLLDYRAKNYISMLIYRSGNVWNKLGYDALKKGDLFGFVFILTPRYMPDSLSFIGKKIFTSYRSVDESCTGINPRDETEKRWQYLAGRSMQYAFSGTGLGNRYQVIQLLY